ncbi:peptidylprolyl isomerase [Nocardioides terrisoli]|uniref:peptidylprolyl isomerase n=1 Tax=Nocardioides terrisoli TaxID=3388267 RepID=UPI00287B884E|nr:peptidylprolyl isomerase [Nocardioides marmorisolisilvae]
MKRSFVAAIALIPLLVLAAACGSSNPTTKPSGSSSPTQAASGPCAYPSSDQPAARKDIKTPPATPTTTKPTPVTITTNKGAINVTLEADKAPCTVNSFQSLASQGYFNDTPCHRLTTAGIFVLQCGDPSGTGTGTPGYTFADELIKDDPRVQPCKKVKTATGKQQICTYAAGTVAMANSGPDTNGSQFFLVYKDSPLPNAYTVFGRMDASGLKTVRSIAAAGLANGAQGDGAPKSPVTITSVK